MQRLQYFLSQSTWDADEINRRRLELLVNAPATAPHTRGVIAIDDSGDPSWPKALRAVRAWLSPYLLLQRWWQAWTDTPPPTELQQLLNALKQGHAINLYLTP